MNTEWLEYGIRLTVVWGALILFYHLVLRDSRNWRRRRYFLLGTFLAGWLIPLLPALPGSVEAYSYLGWSGRVVVGLESDLATARADATHGGNLLAGISWWASAGWLWLGGVIWGLARTLLSLAQCHGWRRTGEIVERCPYPVIRHRSVSGPCTALGCIFLPHDWPDSIRATAVLHEKVHLRKGHGRERLFLLPAQILAWFHPLVWWLSKELEAVQEYETDAEVVERVPLKIYGQTLLLQATGNSLPSRPAFFSSPLKKRIAMLTTNNPGRPWCLRYTFGLAALVLVLVLGCTDTTMETLPAAATLSLDDFTQVDEPPRLLNPAFEDALETTEPERLLLDYVYREIRYPVAVRQRLAGGRYNVEFLIDESGVLRDLAVAEVVEKADLGENRILVIGYGSPVQSGGLEPEHTGRELSDEIKRVIDSMPDWQPARRDGRPVSVRMRLSFEFKIEQ